MKIHVNADKKIEGYAPLVADAEVVVKETLSRFGERITQVEVHLELVSDHKISAGKYRCLMDAQVVGHWSIVASDSANTVHQAIRGACDKLKKAIDSAIGRVNDGAKADSDSARAVSLDNDD